MEAIAVYVNDVAHACHVLQPMLRGGAPAHLVVVACAPALTRHAGRWLSRAARRQWRERWAAELFATLEAELALPAECRLEKVVAQRPLVEVSARLVARLPRLRLLDARPPRLGRIDEPISAGQPAATAHAWGTPVAASAGLTLVLALAD